MLERVQPEGRQRRGVGVAVDAEDPAIVLDLRIHTGRGSFRLAWLTPSAGSEGARSLRRGPAARSFFVVEKEVDLPETFGYLLGLQVQSRKVLMDEDRRYLVYRGVVNERDIVVIWRDTADWKEADFERDRKFVTDQGITDGADEILVNGDSVIPNARSLDPIFKARMFGGK